MALKITFMVIAIVINPFNGFAINHSHLQSFQTKSSKSKNATTFAPWGKDADLAKQKKPQHDLPSKKPSLLTQTAMSMIRFYQTMISPIDGPRSSFLPSSSEYARQAIGSYGLFGFFLGCDRLLRENKEEWIYSLKVTNLGNRKLDPPPKISKENLHYGRLSTSTAMGAVTKNIVAP